MYLLHLFLQANECAAKSIHLDFLQDETCLLPARTDENDQPLKRPTADTYNFVTECFFMTQKCMDLGNFVLIILLYLLLNADRSYLCRQAVMLAVLVLLLACLKGKGAGEITGT